MKRMYSLDVLKLVLAYVVAFFHVGLDVPPGPTVAVEMFFLISGFFLAKKFYSRQGSGYDQWDYTWDHVKSLYPHYLFSLAVMFFYVTARAVLYLVKEPTWSGLFDILYSFYYQIPDVLLLQSSYHYHNSVNYPLWQLSALLISGYFVFGLLVHNEKLSRTLIFPAAILMIQSLLNTGIDLWANYGPIFLPLVRASSPLCIGVLTYCFSQSVFYERIRERKSLCSLAAVLALAGIFAFGERDIIYLVTTPVVILSCMEPGSWLNRLFNRRIFRNWGNLSYAVYLNHALIQRVCYALLFPRLEGVGIGLGPWQQGGVYFAVLTVYSLITLKLVNWLAAGIKARKAVA